MVEIDRFLRPEGTVVIRDHPEVIERVSRIARAVRWTATIHEKEPGSQGREKILVATKNFWKLPWTFRNDDVADYPSEAGIPFLIHILSQYSSERLEEGQESRKKWKEVCRFYLRGRWVGGRYSLF